MRATVITDASFCSQTHAAGWAAWIAADHHERIKRSGVFQAKPQTSAMAELWAAYNGIAIAYQNGARRILIQSDCVIVATALKKPNGKHGFAMFRENYLPDLVDIEYRHVKGHTNHAGSRFYVNRWCDLEARKHMKGQRAKLKGKGK